MASVVQVQRPANPMLTISQIAQGLSKVGLMGAQQRAALQRAHLTPQQQALYTAHLQTAQNQASLTGQQAKGYQHQQAIKEQVATRGNFTAVANPMGTGIYIVNKYTGKLVNPQSLGGGAIQPGGIPIQPGGIPIQTNQGAIQPATAQQSGAQQPTIPQPDLGALGVDVAPGQTQQQPQPISPFTAPNLSVSPLSTRYSKLGETLDPRTGIPTYFSTPTQTALGISQQRQMGSAGLDSIRKWYLDTTDPYIGTLGSSGYKLKKDLFDYSITGDFKTRTKLFNQLSNLYALKKLQPTLAATLTRMGLGGQGGETTREEFKKAVGKNLPDTAYWPPEVMREGNKRWLQKEHDLSRAESLMASRNFPISAQDKLIVPKFATKSEHDAWYRNLTTAQQQNVKTQQGIQ